MLSGDGRSLQAVPGLLDLRLVHNTGAAFSMLRGSTAVLGLLSLVVVIAVLIWLWRQPRLPIWQGLAVGLLLGGSLGNGIDRWRLGYVVDFLALVPINFPIFNPADVAIPDDRMAERSKALRSGRSLARGAGSNPASVIGFELLNFIFVFCFAIVWLSHFNNRNRSFNKKNSPLA